MGRNGRLSRAAAGTAPGGGRAGGASESGSGG